MKSSRNFSVYLLICPSKGFFIDAWNRLFEKGYFNKKLIVNASIGKNLKNILFKFSQKENRQSVDIT